MVFFFFLLNSLWLLTAHGESSPQSRMAWGGKLGLNLSGSSYSPLPANTSNDVRGGLGGGGFFRYRFSDRFSIQPELLLMMKGLELKSNSGGVRTEEEIRMNYLEIPVLFRWTPGKESSRFRLFAGPFLREQQSRGIRYGILEWCHDILGIPKR